MLYITYKQTTPANPNFSNQNFYNNDQLVNDILAANSSTDPAVQRANYYKAQQIVVNAAAAVGIYTKTTSLAWDKNLHGVWIEDSQGEPVFSDAYLGK